MCVGVCVFVCVFYSHFDISEYVKKWLSRDFVSNLQSLLMVYIVLWAWNMYHHVLGPLLLLKAQFTLFIKNDENGLNDALNNTVNTKVEH